MWDFTVSQLGCNLESIALTVCTHWHFSSDFRQQIVSEEVTLAELASTESDCSSAKKGGDLGHFGRGQMQSKSEQ